MLLTLNFLLMKTIRIAILSTAFFCAACSSSKPEPGPDPICPDNPVWLEVVVENYWVNSEAYNCRKENGATMRLSENLWLEMGGGGPSFFLFSPDALTEYFDLADPVLRQQYGDGYFYVSYRLAFDEDSQTITTSYDGIPKSPMKLVALERDYFMVECSPVYPYPDGTEFTEVVFRKQEKASCEARFRDAQSYAEVVHPEHLNRITSR